MKYTKFWLVLVYTMSKHKGSNNVCQSFLAFNGLIQYSMKQFQKLKHFLTAGCQQRKA